MNKEDLFMRVLGSYETMANATVICTGKAGTLTQNEMTVVAGGANDGLALKTAQVEGFSGTEVAKGASDIILMDDSFSSIVGAIMWGRCINDSVRKSLQFLIAGSVTVVVTTFVWALASSSEGPVLSAIQLLWANLIMDTFAAVALATDPASAAQLQRKPDKTTDPLFTINMTKQILGQAFYQITIMLIFHFLGSQILGFHSTDDATLQKHHNVIVRTLVFNAFVFAQIFNSFNCRRLDRKLNVFEGTTKNWYFMAIIAFGSSPLLRFCSAELLTSSIRGCRTSLDMFLRQPNFRYHAHGP
jgi:Ca2+-transporting ATPase